MVDRDYSTAASLLYLNLNAVVFSTEFHLEV
jgi:hypothetical protein